MSTIRLLHTADVHLDAPNRALGTRAAELRERTWEAWERIIEEALDRGVQLLIVAGDLFDSRSPAAKTVERALSGIRRLGGATPPIQTVLLPGTHDCWAESALWDSPRITALGAHVHVLGGVGGISIDLPQLDLTVHGCAHRCDISGQRPVGELRASPEAAINVGVAHGSWERGDVDDSGSSFSEEEIAATELDYLALGHWHSFIDVSAGDVRAINPGSPEVSGFGDRRRGSVALVTLGDGPAQIKRLEVGSLVSRTLEIDVANLSGTEELVSHIEQQAAPERLLDVRLTGLAAPGVMIDPDEAMERLGDSCFALRIRDGSHPALDRLDDQDLDERLTLGKFAQLARERIETADDAEERRIAERALQIGVSMLRRRGDRQ